MWNTVHGLASTIRGKPAGNFKELGVELAIVAGLMILLIVAMAYSPDPAMVNEIGDLLVEGTGAATQTGIATTKAITDDLHSKFIEACVRCRDENIDCPACRGAALPALPEETPPDSTPPVSTPPPVKPPKKTGLNLGPALALAAGGAIVGGPIGAAGGFIIGFIGSLPKKAS
jgi:hypothetical protein